MERYSVISYEIFTSKIQILFLFTICFEITVSLLWKNHFKTNFLGRLSSNFFKNFDFIICTFFYHLSFSAHSGIFISCFYWLESTDPNKWPFAKQPKKYLPLSFLSLECLDGYIDLRVLLLYCKKKIHCDLYVTQQFLLNDEC